MPEPCLCYLNKPCLYVTEYVHTAESVSSLQAELENIPHVRLYVRVYEKSHISHLSRGTLTTH